MLAFNFLNVLMNRLQKILLVMVILLSFINYANGESTTYEWRKPDGGKIYTDRPPPRGIVATRVIKTSPSGGNILSQPSSQLATASVGGKNNEECDTLVAAIEKLSLSNRIEDKKKLDDLRNHYTQRCFENPSGSVDEGHALKQDPRRKDGNAFITPQTTSPLEIRDLIDKSSKRN